MSLQVNGLAPHPYLPRILVCGIDSDVKVFDLGDVPQSPPPEGLVGKWREEDGGMGRFLGWGRGGGGIILTVKVSSNLIPCSPSHHSLLSIPSPPTLSTVPN